ncbi:tetratricopeptide repeat protein [Capilliphycus salinus ALCB114379]|uniref:tetratricopeptide repeat protein n=1 Tax=Capilliphycus salinus TaxID=2768948 RepID=UPI0039A5D24C
MSTKDIAESQLKSLVKTAAQNHQLGQLKEAEFAYKQLLAQIQPDSVEESSFLAKFYPVILMDFALVLQKQGKLEESLELYQQALRIKPDFADAYYNQGHLLWTQGKLEAAIESYQQALKFQPSFAQAYHALANIFQEQQQFEKATQFYQEALKFNPNLAEAYNNFGNLFKAQGNYNKALELYQQAIRLKPNFAQPYNNLGNIFKQQDKLEKAADSYRQAIRINPKFAEAYHNLAGIFFRRGNLEESIQHYQQAVQLNPEFAEAEFGVCIGQLPMIYTDVEEINLRRERYQNCLQNLVNSYQNASPKQQAKASSAVGTLQPFLLTYQGLNDRPLQQTYGKLIHQLMSGRYPQYSQPISNIELAENEKIRVGFVSGFFRGHSNWKIPIKGWVENLNREKFELFGYHTDIKQDQFTQEAKQAFVKFVQGPLTLQQWCETIQQDRLHVLIFPEFGMDTVTLQLGCLRLAPIQMTSWGHPETSGLPTIDYYLSSELMEPENAQEHYTEKLVRLPNLSIHYQPLEILPHRRTKSEIGLREDEIMFWCCQSLYKYLPQYDWVFPEIAGRLKTCKFVFIKYHGDASERVTKVFGQRLRHAFEQWGLDYQDYCIFLPRLQAGQFAGTTALADVFLDSIGWSGCNSSLEAIAYDVPMVTLPGELMRSRHTLAFLKRMGIEETIAADPDDYVSIAVRLGEDAEFRQSIRQRIAENKSKLYGDLKPVLALEDLIVNSVNTLKFSHQKRSVRL